MIEFTCELTKQAYIDYFYHTQKKSLKIFFVLGLIIFLCAILNTVAIFIEPIDYENLIYDITFSVIFLLVGIYFAFIYKSSLLKAYNTQLKTNKFIMSNPITTYQFSENNYKILVTSNLGIEESTYSYAMLHSAVETEKYIFLKFSTNSAYIISKQSIENDDLGKLINLLKTKIGANFISEITK